MKCSQIRQQLIMQRETGPLSDALLTHLQQCTECREYAEELRLQRLLRTLPLREAEAGFENRVLQKALSDSHSLTAQRHGWSWRGAAAAGVVLALLVTLLWRPQPLEPRTGKVATLLPNSQTLQVQPVRVLFNSVRNLRDATITVSLPAHLALEGHPEAQRLQWKTNLSAGDNKLTLPVQHKTLTNGKTDGDEILIELEHNGLRKQFRVPVEQQVRGDMTTEMI